MVLVNLVPSLVYLTPWWVNMVVRYIIPSLRVRGMKDSNNYAPELETARQAIISHGAIG